VSETVRPESRGEPRYVITVTEVSSVIRHRQVWRELRVDPDGSKPHGYVTIAEREQDSRVVFTAESNEKPNVLALVNALFGQKP
jgi:hypothetical protein